MPLLAVVYLLTPADLWLLPDALLDDPPWFGLVFCLGLWFAGFFGGILQLYNLTERGMSLRMLIDVAQSGDRGMTADEIMRDYSAGQGIAWMYQKRLDGLLEGRPDPDRARRDRERASWTARRQTLSTPSPTAESGRLDMSRCC